MLDIVYPSLGVEEGSSLGGSVAEREQWKHLQKLGKTRLHLILETGHPPVEWPNTQIYRVRDHRRWTYERNFSDFQILKKIFKMIDRGVFYVHSPSLAPMLTYVKSINSPPTALRLFHYEPDLKLRYLTQLGARFADRIFVSSRHSIKEFNQFQNIPLNKMELLYCGISQLQSSISTDLPAPLKKLDKNIPVLLALGSLIPRKNHIKLLEAIKTLKSRVNDFVLVVGSDGPLKEELMAFSKTNQLPVVWTGYLSDEQKAAIYQRADIFVTTSLQEGFGIAAAEALQAKIPVVAFKAGSLVEIVENSKSGFLCEPGNVEEFALRLEELILDPDLRQTMGKKGETFVNSNFSWDKIAVDTLSLLTSLSGGHS